MSTGAMRHGGLELPVDATTPAGPDRSQRHVATGASHTQTSRPTVGTGDRYGHLVVVGRDAARPGHLVCRCDCGREKSVRRAI